MTPPKTRLESWKEIATYFEKGVTTVQRWEKEEGLPVHRLEHQSLSSVYAYTAELNAWRENRTVRRTPVTEEVAPQADPKPQPTSRRLWIGGAVASVAAASLAGFVKTRPTSSAPKPLFHSSNSESSPSLSADGRLIVYMEGDSTERRLRLFDRRSQVNQILETFTKATGACQSRISPDGRSVAVLTYAAQNRYDVNLRDRLAGPIRKIAQIDGAGLAFGPDSRILAMTTRPDEGGPVSVYTVNRTRGDRRLVSRPPTSSWGDIDVAASPDGVHFAVARYAAAADGDVWLLSWDGSVERRLTTLHTWINGLAFTADGKEVVFNPVVAHHTRLYRVAIDGTRLTEIPTPGVGEPSASSAGAATLVVQDLAYASRIYKGRIEGQKVVDDRLLTPLTKPGEFASYSRDGSKIAWIQAEGIWVAERQSQPMQIAAIPSAKRDLAWSVDMRHFALSVQDGSDWRIWIVDAATGAMRRLTNDNASEGRPVWSPSGNYIYWLSGRAGEPRFFRRAWPEGNTEPEPEPVSPFAAEGIPSADDRFFYYLENDQRSRVHVVPIGGTSKPRILDHIPHVKPRKWFVRASEILYGDTEAEGSRMPVIAAAIAGGPSRLLCHLPAHPDEVLDISIAPDLTEIVWNRNERHSDVWIIEGFR